MPQRMHSIEDEAVAVEAIEPATLVAENEALRNKLLRALADAENARRRAERSADEARRYAISSFASEILSVADNLKRAITAAEQHPQEPPADAALLEGVRSTERTLLQTLGHFGIRKIEALGAPFDPSLHEAVMEIDDPEREPGTVAEVVQDGYLLHDRLLRPARVVVVKRRADAPAQDDRAQPHPPNAQP